jgi:rod shape determining protein RodA
MEFSISYLKRLDWVLIILSVAITLFGLGGIYSYSLARGDFSDIYKQLIFFAIGLALMVAVSFFDYRIFRNNPYLILVMYAVSIALLAGLYFFAPMIRGTRGWYKIGFVTLDPIEPAKIVIIILLAKYFSMRHVEMYKFKHIVLSGVYVAIPAILIFLKPDMGGASVLVLIWLGILIVSGIKVRHFLILLTCFLLVAGIGWQFVLKDYQKARITSFLFPYDVLGGSWSQTQTRIAIGSGQWLGEGVGKGTQVQYGFLPEPHTDFIFSSMSQDWGLLGIAVFFALYIALIWRVFHIALVSQTNFPRLFAVGFAIMLAVQCVVNIAMNLSLLPVVGIYLPFVSYGGSGLIANFISLGILQSMSVRRQ